VFFMRSQPARLLGLGAVVAVLTLVQAGCGPSVTAVTGNVTYNGKPINRSGGLISFIGPGGIPITADIDSSGNYRATGVRQGENLVTVSYTQTAPAGKRPTRIPLEKEAAMPPAQSSPFLIPEAYALPNTSNLKVVVGRNTVYSPELTGPPLP
jgi:hypothetical protein